MNKEDYLKLVNGKYEGKAKELIKEQIELFFDEDEVVNKTKFHEGDSVLLEKGTYLHGIPGLIDGVEWTVKNGFIGNDFTKQSTSNKIKLNIGMWNIKEKIKLEDYIKQYSGFTITYTIGRGPGSKEVCELIPYHQFDKYTEEISNREDVWIYWGEQTKEVRFMPSLVADKRQIAFILNTTSPSAQKLIKNDLWTIDMDEELAKTFTDYRYTENFLIDRKNRKAITTDRETAIIFGLPPRLIEGVLVGRKVEQDKKAIERIKELLPDCYICNLDGKVIVGNDN